MLDTTLIDWVAKLSSALSESGVDHALAGGLAVAVWARPRETAEIDLVIDGHRESIEAARTAGLACGLQETNRKLHAFRRVRLLRMTIPATSTRSAISVGFLLVPRSLEDSILTRAEDRMVNGTEVPIASAEDTVLLELLKFDEQDRADIRAISGEQHLDKRYLLRMARRLRVLGRLRRAGLR